MAISDEYGIDPTGTYHGDSKFWDELRGVYTLHLSDLLSLSEDLENFISYVNTDFGYPRSSKSLTSLEDPWSVAPHCFFVF